jgi:hypothetical protein
MFLGIYQLGQEVAFRLVCTEGARTPFNPDEAPVMSVYSASSKILTGKGVPGKDQGIRVGLFEGKVFLSEAFEEGIHTILVRYTDGSTVRAKKYTFLILPGGDGSGIINTMYAYDRPHASYIVQGRTSGRIFKGKNPRVA